MLPRSLLLFHLLGDIRCYRTFLARCVSQWGGVESVPPPDVLPLTCIVHICIICQLATMDNKDDICYKVGILAN